MSKSVDDWGSMLVHHDAAIAGLSGRVGHVETKLDVHDRKLDQIIAAVTTQSAQPHFDFHKTVSTVTTLAVLFSMTVAGIVYVAQAQFSGMIAEQKGFNSAVNTEITELKEKIDWLAKVEPAPQRSASR